MFNWFIGTKSTCYAFTVTKDVGCCWQNSKNQHVWCSYISFFFTLDFPRSKSVVQPLSLRGCCPFGFSRSLNWAPIPLSQIFEIWIFPFYSALPQVSNRVPPFGIQHLCQEAMWLGQMYSGVTDNNKLRLIVRFQNGLRNENYNCYSHMKECS